MKRDLVAPDSPQAAAHAVAALVARDGRLDWRELEFLEGSGAFALLGVERAEFLELVATELGKRAGRLASGAAALGPDLGAIRDRRLQLVVAALVVYIADIDRKVRPEESNLVRRAFERWSVTPVDLQRRMGVPLRRSLAALYGLCNAA